MTSFGEAPLHVNARVVGRIRVLNVGTDSALYPRLILRVGIVLQDTVENEFEPGRPIREFELRALSGELRLQEQALTVGRVYWIGHRRYVRSGPYAHESQIDIACDIDDGILEGIEQHRDGGPAEFWMALWPTLVDKNGFLDSETIPFKLDLPRDRWLQTIGAIARREFAVLEVSFASTDRARFEAAIGHIRQAHDRVRTGDYDESVAACRRSLEALANVLGTSMTVEDIASVFAAKTDKRRGDNYADIFKRVKDLANYTIHRKEAPGHYSRVEARFAIGVTEHLVSLAGGLTASDPTAI